MVCTLEQTHIECGIGWVGTQHALQFRKCAELDVFRDERREDCMLGSAASCEHNITSGRPVNCPLGKHKISSSGRLTGH